MVKNLYFSLRLHKFITLHVSHAEWLTGSREHCWWLSFSCVWSYLELHSWGASRHGEETRQSRGFICCSPQNTYVGEHTIGHIPWELS